MFSINLIYMIVGYQEEKQKRFEFLIEHKINFEAKLVKDILSMLVPKFIKTNMIKGKILQILISKSKKFQENFKFSEKHDVSILFSDISNFDEIIAKEQENIVPILDNVFRYFDDLCFSFGAQKIEVY